MSILSHRYVERPDQALLRKLWQIRTEHLTLVLGPQQDWQAFSEVFAKDDTGAVVLEDRHGEPQGFYSMTMIPVEHGGRRAVLLNAKYWYIRKAYRGGPSAMLAGFKILPTAWRKYGWRRLYFVTTAFPMSYASLTRSIGTSYCLQKKDTPAWERQALLTFARRYPEFDESLGLLIGQSMPEELLPPSEEAARLVDEYVSLNPGWREGRTMPLLLPVNGGTVIHAIQRTLRRWWRKRSAKL